jgi:indole-3-glycerol phosphate synthase
VNELSRIVARTRTELEDRRARIPELQLQQAAARRAQSGPPRPFADALAAPGLSVIAEHKRRSPSAGPIRPGSSVAEIARAYERGGAAAISVLTEHRHFDGSLEDLREAHAACQLPLLRKDFIVDPYQLAEAVSAGAAAVLLIVAALQPTELRALHGDARDRGLDVLVEVHDRAELDAALALEAEIIGINNRDLRDFSVDIERTFALLDSIPPQTVVVAESGIATVEHLERLRDHGVHAALIGERLMRADDPELALSALSAGVTL